MDISDYTKQSGMFLKAEDVKSNPNVLWEITAEGDLIKSEKFGNIRLHLPVKNGDEEKVFDCSKTNARFIADALGTDDTSMWVKKLLKLETYKTKTSEGKMVDAINVAEVK